MEYIAGITIFILLFWGRHVFRLISFLARKIRLPTFRLEKKEKVVRHYINVDEVFDGFIGNEKAVHLLKRELKFSINSQQKMAAIGLFGPPSTGKTELARRISKALGLPLITFSKSTLSKEEHFFNEVTKEIEDVSGGMLMAPKMVIFIDEAHILSGRIQDSLLTALENDDRCFRSAHGDINTHNITFVIATTDPGKLRPAFRSRLLKINLNPYSLEEIVEILKWRIDNDDEIHASARFIEHAALYHIAKAGRAIPRQAIDLVKMVAKGISLGDVQPTLEGVQSDMWRTLGCDENGLLDIDRKYLRFLSRRESAGLSLLTSALGLDKDDITEVIEPWLIQNELIERHRSGRRITPKGSYLVSDVK